VSAPRLIVDRLYEALNARRFKELNEMLDEGVLMVRDGTTIRGLSAVCDYFGDVVRHVPGLRMELERVLAESGDMIVTRTRSEDSSPATAQHAAWGAPLRATTRCAVHRLARGRIVQWVDYVDVEPMDEAPVGGVAARVGINQLIGEQAALRRVATLVARGVDQSEVFDAIVSEAGDLFGEEAWLVRYATDGTAAIIAHRAASDELGLAGRAIPMDGSVSLVRRSGRPARVDSYAGLTGPGADFARRVGIVACAAAPLIVQGTPWGALALVSRGPALAAGIQDRLAQFAGLAATAVANAQSRAELRSVADEQAALRRVAELVARGAATRQVFDQVTLEAGRLLGDIPTTLQRYERSGTEVVIMAQSRPKELGRSEPRFTVGARVPVAGETARARVWRTGRAARIDTYDGVAGAEVLPAGIGANVSVPIHVEGRLWGVLSASSPGPPLPAGTEERLTRFCELAGAAIANAESRAALTASRARIVASADEARRRLARDVHDGAQQRLVHALLRLKQARAGLADTDSPTAKRLDESLVQVQAANAQLRELAHGILPAALARGGLRDGVQSLSRHTPLPVDAEVLVGRLPEPVETTAYFVIAEALTNVVKHAGAGRARVRVDTVGDRLEVEVSDDGRGGADPAGGSGLTGLIDRVEAVGGIMSVRSRLGAGTTLSIVLPIEEPEACERPSPLAVTSAPHDNTGP
jgi:signal transduction histidine kinase